MAVELVGVPIYNFGCYYYQVVIDDNDDQNDMQLEEFELECYGLLLPLYSLAVRDKVDPAIHGVDANEQPWYTLLDSKWRALSDNLDLVFPHSYIHREYS